MLIDRTSCRVAVMTGGLMMSLGFLITGFANSIYICIVSFGLIAGNYLLTRLTYLSQSRNLVNAVSFNWHPCHVNV